MVALGTRVLAVQGGGARASYSYGAVLAFFRASILPQIDTVIASSAAAIATAYVLAGQEELVPLLFREAFRSRQLLAPWRLSRIVDVKFLVYELVRHRFALDIEAVRSSPVRLIVQVTDADTARPHHFDVSRLSADEVLLALHASAAIPGLYERPVFVFGRRYIDGGVTDPIPLSLLFRAGAEHVTAVWTRPLTDKHVRASWLSRTAIPVVLRSQSRLVRQAVLARDPAYVEAMRLCVNNDRRVRCVAPYASSSIASRLSRSESMMWKSIVTGAEDMELALDLPRGSVGLPPSVLKYRPSL